MRKGNGGAIMTNDIKDGVKEPVLSRAFEYWRNVDKTVGDCIAKGVKGERIAAE
jgi:catalase